VISEIRIEAEALSCGAERISGRKFFRAADVQETTISEAFLTPCRTFWETLPKKKAEDARKPRFPSTTASKPESACRMEKKGMNPGSGWYCAYTFFHV